MRRDICEDGKTFLRTPDFVEQAHRIEFGEDSAKAIADRLRGPRIRQEALARRRRRAMSREEVYAAPAA